MGEGQLRVRVRAYEREQTWQPDYVAPELAGTIQAANRHCANAALRAAEAANEADVERRAELECEAADARALAGLAHDQSAPNSARGDP